MKRLTKAEVPKVVALALTWDGARVPMRGLSAKARVFLGGTKGGPAPSAKRMAELLAGGGVKEMRICWVPRLSGGREVLALPFRTANGKRVGFRPIEQVPLGEMLGVVYRQR